MQTSFTCCSLISLLPVVAISLVAVCVHAHLWIVDILSLLNAEVCEVAEVEESMESSWLV